MPLILPIAVSSFNIILARSYFQSSIPKGLVESAKIDGANEFQIFFRIILPLSKPMIATISLFLSFGYWNDWFLASLYITDQSKLPIQALLLNNIQANIQYLAQIQKLDYQWHNTQEACQQNQLEWLLQWL